MFFTIKLYLHLNWIVWNRTIFINCTYWQLKCLLMLNWIVWNRTDYLCKIYLVLNNLQRLVCHKTQTTYQLRKNSTIRDYPDYRIIKIGQNTPKSPGDLRRLAVIQTPVKDHQLMLMRKTFKEQNHRKWKYRRIHGSCQRTQKAVEREVTSKQIVFGTVPKSFSKSLEELDIRGRIETI